MYQTISIMRYFGKTLTNGEMYPGNKDPMLSYKIEEVMALNENFLWTYNRWLVPLFAEYKDRDTKIINFIAVDFPKYLEYFEDLLNKSPGKYLFGDNLTVADFHSIAHFFRLSHNELYEHNIILKRIVAKYPKTDAYLNSVSEKFKDYMAT